ncbi:hypothetical protein B0T16DRAFT_104667 [Cercophora newfieldiana]|uniref:Uncharacterized protein n=1 Tax=Cercophora newfieldiana TaxID=92897 RepID=A0AA39YI22_9PEZI|nr:hypothetical protein B0T16DRAFT_104667 [Cercophora newfieldiana]
MPASHSACEVGSDSSVVPINLIPGNLNIALIAGQNASVPWMAQCCAPNRVETIKGCYLWCEIPPKHIHVLEDKSLVSDFNDCVMEKSLRGINESVVASLRLLNAGGPTKPTMAGVCIWALMFVGILNSVA